MELMLECAAKSFLNPIDRDLIHEMIRDIRAARFDCFAEWSGSGIYG